MIIITQEITKTIYIEDRELEEKAKDWGVSVEELVNDLEEGNVEYDDFAHSTDYTINNQKVVKD